MNQYFFNYMEIHENDIVIDGKIMRGVFSFICDTIISATDKIPTILFQEHEN